jgi:hypothetical protein
VNSSLRTTLKEDCHSYTDGFTTHSLLPIALSHSACHENNIARRRQEQTSLPRARSEKCGRCVATTSVASLPGRPQCPSTQQNAGPGGSEQETVVHVP